MWGTDAPLARSCLWGALASTFLLIAGLPAGAAELSAASARKFFNDKGCNACHGIDEMRLAPSFRSIALLYAGASAETIERLEHKIRFGGAGAWGVVPMISYPGLSEEEIRSITRWILSLQRDEASRP
jgi:cytochrome c551/c552